MEYKNHNSNNALNVYIPLNYKEIIDNEVGNYDKIILNTLISLINS